MEMKKGLSDIPKFLQSPFISLFKNSCRIYMFHNSVFASRSYTLYKGQKKRLTLPGMPHLCLSGLSCHLRARASSWD